MNLLRVLLAVVVLVAASASWAFPATSGTQYSPHTQYGGSPEWMSAAQASARCDQLHGVAAGGASAAAFYTASLRCGYSEAQSYSVGNPWATQTGYSCPANSTLGGTQCTCNSGWTTNGTNDGCVSSSQATCDALVAGGNATWPSVDWTAQVSGPGALEFCSGNCQVRAQGATYYQQGGTWRGSFHAPYSLVATSCSLSAPTGASAASAPQTCPVGQCPGSFNNVAGCYPCGASTSTSTQTTTSTPTSASGVAGTPTTTTQTSTTTCQNGACTTTTSTNTSTPGSGGNSTTSTSTSPARPAGSASGAGAGGLPGDDPCVQNPSRAGCGGTPATVGSLYTPKTKTFQSVLTGFRNGVQGTPLGSGVGNFFTVSASGSCPTWTFDIDYLSMSYVMDVWCLSWATTALTMMGAALMVVAGFFAFRTVME